MEKKAKRLNGVAHKIRGNRGGVVDCELTRGKAIKAMCTECMGWETNPKDCMSILCPLYPYRGKIMLAYE